MSKRGTKKGHKRSSSRGRYSINLGGSLDLGGLPSVGAQFRPMEQMQSSAFGLMQKAYNDKQKVEMAGLNADQRKLQREMNEKMGDMQEQQAEQRASSEKAMRKKAAENAERFAEQRADMEKQQRKMQRDMQKRATEQRDKMEKVQLDMEKQRADGQLKMAEEWAKNAASMGSIAFNIPSAASIPSVSPIVGPHGGPIIH